MPFKSKAARVAYDAACYLARKPKMAAYRAVHEEELAAYRHKRVGYKAAYDVSYRATHKSERAAYNATYRATHKSERAERLKTDMNYRLARNLRARLYMAIRNGQKVGSAVKDLGCSIEHLKLHLQLFWDEGMNWGNYGKRVGQWSIDHIKPVASFDLTDRKQFLEANHYLNLQPLWAVDNFVKGSGGHRGLTVN